MEQNHTLTKYTSEDADRLLGLGDQFLEDWALDAVNENSRDEDYEERNAEWEIYRPLFVAAPDMFAVLEKTKIRLDMMHDFISEHGFSAGELRSTRLEQITDSMIEIDAAMAKAKAVQS